MQATVSPGCSSSTESLSSTYSYPPEDNSHIPLAATLYPTEEEFKNPLEYIESIKEIGEKYGIVKIVPPGRYKLDPADDFSDLGVRANSFKFICKIQNIHQLQFRNKEQKYHFDQIQAARGKNLLPSNHVETTDINSTSPLKRKIFELFPTSPQKRVKPTISNSMEDQTSNLELSEPSPTDDLFGFERTKKEISLSKYKDMADEFYESFFTRRIEEAKQNQSPSKQEMKKLARSGGSKKIGQSLNYIDNVDQITSDDIEKEYWRIVHNQEESLTVQYGNDLPVSDYQSFFPQGWKCDWDAKILPKLPDSLLSFLNIDIPGVNIPMLYVGMLFSSFCWHVEDHFMYAINFIHHGACKQWYGIPAHGAEKFEAVFRKMFPHLINGQPAILHMLVTQISPSLLAREGVPVYKIVHEPGTFIITFPRAYHAGFNQGFNIAESVNFTTPSWLQYNRLALSKYYDCKRATTFPSEQLILSAVTAIISGKRQREKSKFFDQTSQYLKSELNTITQEETELRRKLLEHITDKVPNQMPQISNRNIERLRTCSQKDNNMRCCNCSSDCYISGACIRHSKKKEDYYCLKCAITKAINDQNFGEKCHLIERVPIKDLEVLYDKLNTIIDARQQQ